MRERWIALETVGSTSDLALQLARDRAPSGVAVSARQQSAGRGRKGNRWQSPPGNVHLSVIAPPLPHEASLRQMLYLAGVAIAESVRELLSSAEKVLLKWPNDVMIDGRKVAGLLVESADDGRLVIGIGLNVETVPAGVANPVTTLREHGSDAASDAVARRCARRLFDAIDDYRRSGFSPTRQRWLEFARDLGQEISVRIDGRVIRGILDDIDHAGAAVLVSAAEAVSASALRIVRSR